MNEDQQRGEITFHPSLGEMFSEMVLLRAEVNALRAEVLALNGYVNSLSKIVHQTKYPNDK